MAKLAFVQLCTLNGKTEKVHRKNPTTKLSFHHLIYVADGNDSISELSALQWKLACKYLCIMQDSSALPDCPFPYF